MKKLGRTLTAALLSLALFLPLLPAQAAQTAQTAIVDPYSLMTYEELCRDIGALEARYPQLITAFTLGTSAQGLELPAFTLGRGSREVVLTGAMHAREYITTNFLMHMAEGYAAGYVSNGTCSGYSYRALLDAVTFYIVPMMNPDGVVLAQGGPEALPNPGSVAGMPITELSAFGYAAWKANANGVDLNRNYPYGWNPYGGSSKVFYPASAEYRGPAAGSEPETQAIMKFLEASPFALLCSFHTAGEVIYWSDTDASALRQAADRPVAEAVARCTGYALQPPNDISQFGGSMTNWIRNVRNRCCMTVELCPAHAQYPYPPENFAYLESIYPIGLVLAAQALTLAAAPCIQVTVNGRSVAFPGARPVIDTEGYVLAPIQDMVELCGLELDWNDQGQALVRRGSHSLILTADDRTWTVDGNPRLLPCAPRWEAGRLLVPVGEVFSWLGFAAVWEGSTRRVVLTG